MRKIECPDCGSTDANRIYAVDKPSNPVFGKDYFVHSLWQCKKCKRVWVA